MPGLGIVLGALLIVAALGLAGVIAFGGPTPPPPLASIRDAVLKRDRTDLPEPAFFPARDQTTLAYRAYPAAAGPARGAAILIHGSAGSGADMHEIAKALTMAGLDAYAPDLRGHGTSGTCGDIVYIGQLEDDLADLLDELDRRGAPARRILIGHSSGGGFALRVAALPLSSRFLGTILLSPYLGHDAPTASPRERGWANVGLPRLIGLAILNQLGVRALNWLPVVAFAVDPAAVPHVTPAYSFRLRLNFAPHRDWRRDIASTRGPLLVLVGARDELFQANLFAELFAAAPKSRVELLANIDHMGITGDPSALSAIVMEAVKLLADP
jgi:alpha-beta hydrolase superfamily lysophospholipase